MNIQNKNFLILFTFITLFITSFYFDVVQAAELSDVVISLDQNTASFAAGCYAILFGLGVIAGQQR